MNNTDKLLRAFIEASGYEIETARTKKGRPYASLSASPAGADVHKFVDGLFYEYDVDYKVTKCNHKTVDIERLYRQLGLTNEKPPYIPAPYRDNVDSAIDKDDNLSETVERMLKK